MKRIDMYVLDGWWAQIVSASLAVFRYSNSCLTLIRIDNEDE